MERESVPCDEPCYCPNRPDNVTSDLIISQETFDDCIQGYRRFGARCADRGVH